MVPNRGEILRGLLGLWFTVSEGSELTGNPSTNHSYSFRLAPAQLAGNNEAHEPQPPAPASSPTRNHPTHLGIMPTKMNLRKRRADLSYATELEPASKRKTPNNGNGKKGLSRNQRSSHSKVT
jgi:hypothetical protein